MPTGEPASEAELIRAANALHDQALQQQQRGRLGRAPVLCRHALGDLTTAERLFRRTVEITAVAATDPDTHIVYIQSVDGLAGVLRLAACYAEAEPLYHRALAHAERHLGAEHAEAFGLLNNLGVL